MPLTIHKILVRSPEVIDNNLLLIKQLIYIVEKHKKFIYIEILKNTEKNFLVNF